MGESTQKKSCNKVKFSTESYANEYIDKLRKTSTRDKIPVRAYLCEHCLLWHLTSRENKEDPKLREEINRLKNVLRNRDGEIKNKKKIIDNLHKRIYELTHKK